MNLGRKWVETEDEGKSSCEKLRVVLAVLLVVAVCQITPSEITKNRIFGPPKYIQTRPFGRPTPAWGPTELPINHLWWLLLVQSGPIDHLA